ncbi:hypothetical protein [Pedobacter sp. ASV28]|uniref:hypothetical protein n=1 Tax=Pedobacter sp. ASV28 TaxID=2795123 RepID=UPI0018EA821F|nr:hypothetical protein [Pedobacter sp. ASV28]
MKKLALLLLCFTTLGMVSCKKDTYITETQNKTIFVDVLPSDWILDNSRNTYYVQLEKIAKLPEINASHINNDGTLVYVSYPNNNGNFTDYSALPFVYNLSSYSFTVYNGGLEVYIQNSDTQNIDPIKPTTKVRFKLVLVYSKNVT